MRVYLVAAVLFVATGKVFAAYSFTDGKIHDIDYAITENLTSSDQVSSGKYTTVNLLVGGEVSEAVVCARGNSQVNILGGTVSWGNVIGIDSGKITMSGGAITGGQLIAQNDSQVVISGGMVNEGGNIIAKDNSHITMSGGTLSDGFFTISGNSHVVMSGGTVSSYLTATGDSQVDISGGAVVGWLVGTGDSQVTISGGMVRGGGVIGDGGVEAVSRSHITLRGGIVDCLEVADLATLTIYGSNFAINGSPVGFGTLANTTGMLTGTLVNGDVINTPIYKYDDTASIVLVPEPISFALLGLGSLLLRRRKN